MLMKPHMKVVYNLEEGAATDAGICHPNIKFSRILSVFF
jgi:hypothetical protein